MDILAGETIRHQLLDTLCRQLGECESIETLLELASPAQSLFHQRCGHGH